jgi:hypothetical protein
MTLENTRKPRAIVKEQRKKMHYIQAMDRGLLELEGHGVFEDS